jgi:formiminotetrahydrofolate cyclodeaminase
MREVRAETERARHALLSLADRDAAAFDDVMEAFRMPKATDEEKAVRAAAIQRAYLGAAEVPLEIARTSVALMPLAVEAVEHGNVNATSDGISAGQMLFAGAACGLANARINAAGLKDQAQAGRLTAEVASLEAAAEERLAAANAAFASRLG